MVAVAVQGEGADAADGTAGNRSTRSPLGAAPTRAKEVRMASASFAPCPECQSPLAYLVGVSGSQMNPKCPCCHVVVTVSRATLLMADHSRPSPFPAARKAPLRDR